MPALLCDGREVAALEIAEDVKARLRGLLGRDGIDGAMLIPKTSSVHTIGMRFAIDIAFIDSKGLVVDVMTLKPQRACLPRLRAHSVVEAEAGAFARWGLGRGTRTEIRP